ncbi:hypothetical protein NDU88_005728 [Pleurodeles waltl]|uniref:Uncharacterized protein n=1 Tax=Pleurodeles waltl TaxID=8319 RepID=A0AAV7LNK9_PLEWA|nr:hypothetical protein NDU88_005728 [Pleurodeles waltl]
MFDEYMKGLEKKLCKLEEEITGKKQRKYIRDFKDYQAGRILTFQRKYDHMYEGSTDVNVRNIEQASQPVEEQEESDISDGNLSDVPDTVLSGVLATVDINIDILVVKHGSMAGGEGGDEKHEQRWRLTQGVRREHEPEGGRWSQVGCAHDAVWDVIYVGQCQVEPDPVQFTDYYLLYLGDVTWGSWGTVSRSHSTEALHREGISARK